MELIHRRGLRRAAKRCVCPPYDGETLRSLRANGGHGWGAADRRPPRKSRTTGDPRAGHARPQRPGNPQFVN